MRAPCIARGFQTELARRIAAEHVALKRAIHDQLTVARGDPFAVERTAAQGFWNVGSLAQFHEIREYLLSGRAQQEGTLAVLAAAAYRAQKMADEPARDFRRVQ